MDEELERLLVGVRVDTGGFARDVAGMRMELEGALGEGAERAGRAIDTALSRAVRTGKLGFDDLKRYALSAMAEIAAGSLKSGIGAVLGGQRLGGIASALLGLPGRATGGLVSPGRAYVVGERGPELFVPTAGGRVEASSPGAGREVRVSITVNAGAGAEPRALAQSGRQVAREVRRALMRAE